MKTLRLAETRAEVYRRRLSQILSTQQNFTRVGDLMPGYKVLKITSFPSLTPQEYAGVICVLLFCKGEHYTVISNKLLSSIFL